MSVRSSGNSRFEEPLISEVSSKGPQPRQNIIRNICIFILVMELAERLCFYTFTSSIIVFLRDYLDYPQASAAALFSIFNTLVYLTPLLGGYIADSYWGRYKTIAVFGSIYFAGTVLMSFSSIPDHESKGLFMFAFFGLVTLGAGGIKSNVVTMGGDQFNLDFEEESAQKDTYFIYFYWCINIGALVSYFVLAQMATEPTQFGLPRGSGFFVTFCASAGALAMALLVFFSATNRYILKKPTGSATGNYCKLVWRAANAAKMTRQDCTVADFKMETQDRRYAQMLLGGVFVMVIGTIMGIIQPFSPAGNIRDNLTYGAFGCAMLSLFLVCYPTVGMPEWMGRRGGRAVMLTTRVIPILFNTISFQVVYAAMQYFSISACQMDVNLTVGGTTFQINGSMLNAADCLAIIVMVPILDGFIYPTINSCLGRKFKPTEKYMCGMFVSIAAIGFAAYFEVLRRDSVLVSPCIHNHVYAQDVPSPSPTSVHDDDAFYYKHEDCYSLCAAQGVGMSSFSVWWMAIPYFLVGFGECLCNVPIYELCYSQTPPAYRSMAQAVFLFITALGSMLTGAFTTVI